ncbi:MAG TPA: radical SAM protein [Desulfuromonadaceae bacterium]|jgi:MoaA/NifB/PqqE/SkfB family radical SAM enzyme
MHRLAKLAYRIALSNISELLYPYRLTYAVTNRCQARCVMCGIWQKQPADELSLAEIDTFFSRSNRFSWINLTGGELFLRDDIVDIIRSINKHCRELYLLNFPTNGYQTEHIVAAVQEILTHMSIPRLMVTISLDGPRELHDHIRGLTGAYLQALSTFRRLRELRSRHFSVYLGYTLQEANLHLFQDTLEAVRSDLGALAEDEIHVNLAHISGHYYANSMFAGVPDPRETEEVFAHITAKRTQGMSPVGFLEQAYQRLARIYLKTGRVPLTCEAAAASCFMDPTGLVYPCTSFDSPLGSIRDHDYHIYRLWRTPERQRARKAVCNEACPGCWTPCEAYQTILANLLKKSIFL